MSALLYLTLLTCLNLVVNQNEAARILGVFPFPSISHQVAFRPLMHELAKRGHEVTVITTDPAFPKGEAPANLTEIDVGEISYKMWRDEFVVKPKGKKGNMQSDFYIIYKLNTNIFDAQLKDEQVQKLIHDKNQRFDLVITEAWVRPALVFSHYYKAPVIMISSFGTFSDNYEVMGVSMHPFLYHRGISRRLYNLTLWEKVVELYDYLSIEWIHRTNYNIENKIIKAHFGPDTPTVQELNNNVAMFFVNLHPVFEGNTPVPPSVIHMGGIHQKPRKDLPQDLQLYLDSSKNGVIYVSFGTNVDPALFPPEKIATFVRVFSKLPYDVLWKWSKDELPGRTENIKISKWLPQSDLLRHPKIKLFITQGGLQSTDEAITAGVPLIGLPMFGDQWYDVEKYEKHNIGLKLDLESLNDEILENAINKVIGDDSYRQNIIRLGKIMQDQPMTPLERVVWWTEHVLRHGGGKHLRAPAANMSWAEYLELELDLKSYLDSSKHGVIYISFGTNVEPSALPPEKIQILVQVLGRLPYNVLWKWNKDVLPGQTENMRISKWLPQSDLLKHPKVKLFITQGGLQSTDEAINAGVPLIGLPMREDKWFNVERYERHNIGKNLDMETLTEEIFENAIKTVISDESYRRNLERLGRLLRDQPQPPLERAVWWTEHVLRHGGTRHLRAPAANMSWAQYLELELVLVILLGFLIVLTIVSVILRTFLKKTFKVKRS